jgi:hypothetical protein
MDKQMEKINFTFADFIVGVKEADNRHFRAVLRNFNDSKMARIAYGTELENEVIGALGEIAVARYFNLRETLNNETFTAKSDLPNNLNVRATKWPYGKLFIYKKDRDDLNTVFVTIKPIMDDPRGGWLQAELKGWIANKDAKRPDLWSENLNTPAYAITQNLLRPITEL